MRSLTISMLLLAVVGCAPDVPEPITQIPTAPEPPPPPPAPPSVRWSDPGTWAPNSVPLAGADVEIPAGKTVELDSSSAPLGRLQINGTLVVLPGRDVELRASEIHINGVLRAGTADVPYEGHLVITLTGADSPDTPPVGAKALAVYPGGALELYGAKRVSWTRLSATTQAGSNVLQLERPVDWQAGDQVVIASTDFEPSHAEQAGIVTIGGNALMLSRGMTYRHWGTTQLVDGKVVDQRAEVGLLTRNIRIESDSFGLKGFGGHIITLAGGIMHVDGVEVRHMGQKGRMGRYSLHWHMAGDVTGQFVRNSSIWQTNNRCLTIHGTDNAAASNNVCYDHIGHGYFLEDGAESGNHVTGNLGLLSRVPDLAFRLLGSDATPATFWITNPANDYEGNVAAGSIGFGFWYALPAAPTGLSTGGPDRPRLTPLGLFRNNVAHSNKRPGLQVDDGPIADGTTETTNYTPKVGAVSTGAPVMAKFENFVGWKHSGRAVWLRGNSHVVTGAILSDNLIGATFAASSTTLEHSLIVGETDNITTSPNPSFPIRGYEFYDGTVGSNDVTFANFVSRAGRPASALGYNRANGFPTSTDNFAQGIQLRSANGVYIEAPSATKDGDKGGTFRDIDGTISGNPGWTIIPNLPFLVTTGCVQRTEWNAWACPQRFVGLQVVSESGEPVAPTVLRRDDGVSVSLVGVPNAPTQATMTLLPSRSYTLEPGVAPAAKTKVTLQRSLVNDWIRIAIPFDGTAVAVLRDFSATSLVQVATLAEVDASTGDKFFWDVAQKQIVVKLLVRTGKASTTIQVQKK